MSLGSAATVMGLSHLLAGHTIIDARPSREIGNVLSAVTDVDDSFAPVAFDRGGAANSAVAIEASRDAIAVAADIALLQTLSRVNAGVNADQERALATLLSTERRAPNAVRLLTDCADSPSVRLPTRRFAVLALGALGEARALRKALRAGQPALVEAALNAIDWWSLPGFEAELRAISVGTGARWLREYAEDLLA